MSVRNFFVSQYNFSKNYLAMSLPYIQAFITQTSLVEESVNSPNTNPLYCTFTGVFIFLQTEQRYKYMHRDIVKSRNC